MVEVAGPRVRVSPPLRFKHFGEVTLGVDQRAEVGGWAGGHDMAAPPAHGVGWGAEAACLAAQRGTGHPVGCSCGGGKQVWSVLGVAACSSGSSEAAPAPPAAPASPPSPAPVQVALLSRSIRVVGANDTPGIGCHTIAYEGFKGVCVWGGGGVRVPKSLPQLWSAGYAGMG